MTCWQTSYSYAYTLTDAARVGVRSVWFASVNFNSRHIEYLNTYIEY